MPKAGVRELFGLWGIAVDTEKDVVNVLVSAEQRDILLMRLIWLLNWIYPVWGLCILLSWKR